MSIFTSFFVLLLLLSKNVPSATDAIPLIGVYYCLNMVMIATSTICCTMVVHIFFRGQGQVPWILRKVFLEFLARIFCMVAPPQLPPLINSRNKDFNANKNQAKPTFIIPQCNLVNQPNGELVQGENIKSFKSFQVDSNAISHVPQETSHLLSTSHQLCSLNTNQPQQNTHSFQSSQARIISISQNHSPSRHVNCVALSNHSQNQQAQINSELFLSFSLIENDIKEIRDYLRHTRKKLENTDSKTKQTNDWKQVALVLDRGLFFLYIIAIIVSIAIMFNSYS